MLREDFSFRELRKKQTLAHQQARGMTEGSATFRYGLLRDGLAKYGEWFFGKRDGLVSFIKEYAAAHKDQKVIRILDYGCGANIAMRELSRKRFEGFRVEVIGISAGDPRTKEERAYDKTHRIGFIDQAGPTFPEAGRPFDLIVTKDTVKYLYDPLRVMKELYRALTPGGKLILDQTPGLNRHFKEKRKGSFTESARGVAHVLALMQEQGVDFSLAPNGVLTLTKGGGHIRLPVRYRTSKGRKGRELYEIHPPITEP